MYVKLITSYSFDPVAEKDDIIEFKKNHTTGWVISESTKYITFKAEETYYIEKKVKNDE